MTRTPTHLVLWADDHAPIATVEHKRYANGDMRWLTECPEHRTAIRDTSLADALRTLAHHIEQEHHDASA